MHKSIKLFLAFLIAFAAYPLRAQYQWHITKAPPSDTVDYIFTEISCSGESCSALGNSFTPPNGSNSNILFHSNDGGKTWNPIQGIPQRYHTWQITNGAIHLQCIEQIDSLDAIASGSEGTFVRTFDGWNTWEADTFNFPPVIYGQDDSGAVGFGYLDFSDISTGVLVDGGDQVDFWTSDSGQHWTERQYPGGMHPYGNGMWREWRVGYNNTGIFNKVPDTILTTLDNWSTVDTTTFFWGSNWNFRPSGIIYGDGDTLFSFGYSFDSVDNQIATMVRSTDLGGQWTELSVPQTNRIANPSISGVNSDTLVIAGEDSTGEILMSTDRGTTWELYTVPLDNGAPYYWIKSIAVTGSGRVVASIETDSNVDGYLGTGVLAYLEKVPSSVALPVSTQQYLTLYPNPAKNILNLASSTGTISISDPLGRNYEVKQTGNTLDISTLPSGVYCVSDGVSRAKFVKE